MNVKLDKLDVSWAEVLFLYPINDYEHGGSKEKNNDGDFLTKDENGRQFHVQRFIEGKVYDLNTAPDWLLPKARENRITSLIWNTESH